MPGWNPLTDRRRKRLAQLEAFGERGVTTASSDDIAAFAGLATLGWAERPALNRFVITDRGRAALATKPAKAAKATPIEEQEEPAL